MSSALVCSNEIDEFDLGVCVCITSYLMKQWQAFVDCDRPRSTGGLGRDSRRRRRRRVIVFVRFLISKSSCVDINKSNNTNINLGRSHKGYRGLHVNLEFIVVLVPMHCVAERRDMLSDRST